MGDKGEDTGEGMQCSEHPYRKNPGGICAFCLQEKLGKLVSSSKSNSFYPIAAPSSSSSSPSFRSDGAVPPSNQIPFFAHKKKKVMSSTDANLILKRSRSVAVPRHLSSSDASDDSPRKKSFWSFLHLSRRRALRDGQPPQQQQQQQTPCAGVGRKDSNNKASSGGDENESPNSSHASSAASSSFGRKVARSRLVGCGSRSFSGDLLERISTGLGDCALRRVESQREAKPKMVLHRVADNERIKQRVIFFCIGSNRIGSVRIRPNSNPSRKEFGSGWCYPISTDPHRRFCSDRVGSGLIGSDPPDRVYFAHL